MRTRTGFVTCLVLSAVLFGTVGVDAQTVSFDRARPDYQWRFPEDHGSHPDYRTEWWYFTGIVSGEEREYGYQFTIFRSALDQRPEPGSDWFTNQVYMGHVAIADLTAKNHRSYLRIAREHPQIARADTSFPGTIRVRDWRLKTGDTWVIEATGENGSFHLNLTPTRPPLFQGPNGYSKKGPGSSQASHYYSLTRMRTSGTITVGGDTESVRGETWFDHEFGSSQLSEQQTGWDWISLRLSSGHDLMVYRLREKGGRVTPESSATLRGPDGAVSHIPSDQWSLEPLDDWTSSVTGARYPVRWRVRIREPEMTLIVDRSFDEQEMVMEGALNAPYWEGVITAEGQLEGDTVEGEGFLEMTGYVTPLEDRF